MILARTRPGLLRVVGPVALVLLAASCASRTRETEATNNAAAALLTLDEAPPQQARNDQCPLVLYTRSEPSRRLLVAFDRPARAILRVRGEPLELERSATGGAARLGHFEQQTYAGGGYVLVVDIRFEALQGAVLVSAIRSATVSLTDAAGETIVAPAVGLVSCGPNAARSAVP